VTICQSVTDAAYNTVHDHPGGAPVLAVRLGVASARVLDNKVNPRSDHHKLTLDEAVKLMVFTGDLQILQAIAERVGHLVMPLPVIDCVSDTALLETYTGLIKEVGEFSATFHDAIADGVMTVAEMKRMRQEMHDFFRAGEELLSRAEQLVDE